MVRTVAKWLLSVAVAGFVGFYAFFDNALVAPIIIGLVVGLGWPLVFAISVGFLGLVSTACTIWMLRRWDEWIASSGERLERQIAKLRRGRVMRHPLRWIARGSTLWFAIACAILGLIIPAAVYRLAGAADPTRGRLVVGSLAYAVCTAGIYTAAGYGVAVAAGTA